MLLESGLEIWYDPLMENIENLMLEHLKRFQATLERVESKTDELIVRMGHLEVAPPRLNEK